MSHREEKSFLLRGDAPAWGISLYVWLGLFYFFGLLTLAGFPPVNYNLGDEIWALRHSLDTVERGMRGGLVEPRLYFAAQGYYTAALGGGVFAARSFSLLAATLTLYLTYRLGREMMDERAGLLSSVLLGTTFAFSWHSRVVRPETMTALFVVASFFLLYCSRGNGKGLYAFFSGLLVTLSVQVHPNNLQYAIAFVILYPVFFRKKVVSAPTLFFTGGFLLGALFWVVAAYFPSRPAGESSVETIRHVGAAAASFPLVKRNFFALFLDSLVSLPKDYLQYLKLFDVFFPNMVRIAVPAAVAGAIWAGGMLTGNRRDVLLLLLFVLGTSFVNYFVAPKYGYWHMVEFYPFLALAAVSALYGMKERLRGRGRTAFLLAAVLFFVSIGTADTVAAMYRLRGYDYERLLEKVSASVDGRVMAMDRYYPAFRKEDFVKPWFNVDQPYKDCPPFGPRVKQLGVRYIIVDSVFLTFSRKSCGAAYEKDIVRYLTANCETAAWVNESYPNYWVPGKVVSEIYVYRTRD